MFENRELTNLQKLDFAIEKTIAKFARTNQSFEYKEKFAEDFVKKGFVPNLFTREEGARDLVMNLNTETILSEILKYASRAKFVMFETRYDEELMKKYPFMKPEELKPLQYASLSPDNLKNVITFFINERYAEIGAYTKNKTDKPELFAACRNAAKEIDEYLNLSQRQL